MDNNLTATQHGAARMRQRGLRDIDIALLVQTGTLVGSDTYFMTRDDVAQAITQRKREIQQIERLRNVKAVVCGGMVVTAYHASPKARRSILRRERATR